MKPHVIAAALMLMPIPALAEGDMLVRCAGIGDEGQALEAVTPHSLKIVYADADGAYLGQVVTRIATPDGAIVAEVACDAPWVLANLVPGDYVVNSHFGGQEVETAVSVDIADAKEVVITF